MIVKEKERKKYPLVLTRDVYKRQIISVNFITFDITKLTDFCLFNTLYCAISGIISVENEAKNIDGKFKSGNAIPLITPNIDREVARCV